MSPALSPEVLSLLNFDAPNGAYSFEPVRIEAVISPKGQGVAIRDSFDVHMFTLEAWRMLPGGTVQESELVVLRPVPQDHDCEGELPPGTTHRFEILMSVSQERAIFLSSEPDPNSTHFAGLAATIRSPRVIEHEQFGELELDKSTDFFDGDSTWNDAMVRISIASVQDRPHPKSLETAKLLWANQVEWKRSLDQFAVENLLILKNEKWRKDKEKEVTAESLIKSLELETIQIQADGTFKFWFSDGGLFRGHAIVISGDIKSGPVEARLQG